jgi:hypothetical protein
MARSAADRQRALRRRDKQRVVPHRIDVGEDVFSALEHVGFLSPDQVDDPEAVRAALTRMASAWAKSANPFL